MDTNHFIQNLIVIAFYIMPLSILAYSIYRYKSRSTTASSSSSSRNANNRSTDSIPDVKERMRLFNERKEALIARARHIYLKKQADATKLIE